MSNRLFNLIQNSRGATAVEYGLIVALIVIAIIGSLQVFAGRTISMWTNIASAVSTSS